MAIKQSVVNLNIVAAGAILKKRFITRPGGQAVANQSTIGVNDYSVEAGYTALCDHAGVTMVEAGAAIAVNVAERRLETDAQGRAVTYTTGPAVALLFPGASASSAGQLISVILLSN